MKVVKYSILEYIGIVEKDIIKINLFKEKIITNLVIIPKKGIPGIW